MPFARPSLILSLALLGVDVAAAQTAPPPAPPPPSQTAGGQLEEITVTATRRAEPLSKVAESVSAFDAIKMEVQGVKSFADLAKFTPGVDFDKDSNAISIRGVKSNAGSATTGVYIDDTPIQLRALGLNANSSLPAVFDLDRVEVLRGPQGTLFGAGSEGGTVRYITPQPSLTDYSGFAHAELAGTEDGGMSYEAGGAVGGPIVEDLLGFRVSAWGRHDGGWIDKVNPYDGTSDDDDNRTATYVVHAALAYKPIDGLTITPSYNFEQRSQNNYNQYWVTLSDPNDGRWIDSTPETMADYDRFDLGSVKIEYDTDDYQVISNTSYFTRDERLNGYSGTLYDLSYFQQLTSGGIDPQGAPCVNLTNCLSHSVLLSPGGINLPGFGPYVAINYITNTQRNLTQEIRIQSPDSDARLTWTAGVFYDSNSQRSTEEINDPQLPALSEYLWNEDIVTAWGMPLLPNGDDYINDTVGNDMQIAVFGDASYKILDDVKLEVGLRFAYTHFDFHNLNNGSQDLLDSNGVPAQEGGSKDERPVTPKFSGTWQFTPDDMVYATIAKGYRIGGASPPLPVVACGGVFPTSYDSDTTWSYEIGTKDRFFDRKVQISASAYYVEWSNIQQAVYVPQCGIQYTTNVGNAISEGFDVDGQWQIDPSFRFEFAFGYTDAKYDGDAMDPASPGQFLARNGDSLDVVPWTVTLGGQYNFNVGDDDAFIRADWEYASRRHRATPAEDPGTEYFDAGLRPDPATNFVSLRTGIIMDSLEMNLFVDNLFDSHPQLSLAHQDEFTRLYTAETFRPRTIGVTASYRW
ncbi:MAG TPA: TonB-dependent receptor [Stellaceae bacterium]|nr:TonB-dependent receptor [Stellaceae bacterium]